MRNLLLGLLLVTSASAQAAPTWVWHKACTADAAITQCDVWFNSLEPVDTLTLTINGEAQTVTVKTYTELEVTSTNAVLLHLPGLTRDERRAVHDGLSLFVKSSRPFQSLGIFASGKDDLQAIGFPGARRGDLLDAVSRWRSDETAKDPAGDLAQVIEILGGNPVDRKVVYWITSGLDLSDAQVGTIETAAADQGVRIIILHLVRSELDINSSPALRQLGEQAHGFYDFKTVDAWQSSLGALGIYSANGARLTFEGANLCGAVPATFTASLNDAIIETSETISFPACLTGPQSDPAPESIPVSSPEPASEPETPEPETTTNEDASETEASGEEQPLDEGMEGQTDAEMTGDDEAVPAADEPAEGSREETGLTTFQFGLMGGIGLLVALVLIFMIKGKKKTAPVSAMDARGYLEFESAGEYQRVPINQDSITLGRGEDNDVVLKDDTVSASHAVIKVERSGQVLLVDLKSSNGSFVNDEEVTQQELKPGDHLRFGNYHVVYAGK